MTTATGTKLNLQKGGLTFTFLESGDLYQASGGQMMINQLLANSVDGAAGNLYIRLHQPDGIRAYPLLGVKSGSTFHRDGERLLWQGELPAGTGAAGSAEKLAYQVTFTLAEADTWFWNVRVEGRAAMLDVIYTQDVGIAAAGAVTSNEAYLSQYIDHSVFTDQTGGYVVCSRQNQPQGGKFPYLQQGLIGGAAGYSTDGFQFFGLSYKETDRPEALYQESLANKVYQYEFAYTALQSPKTELNGEAVFTFYGLFREDHPAAVSGLEYARELQTAWSSVQKLPTMKPEGSRQHAQEPAAARIGTPLQTVALSEAELDTLFPQRFQEERENGELLAFFTGTYEHVVLKSKELLVERPHGHILMSGDNARLDAEVMTTTSYMYGIFNSQVVVGNTNFNKMLSNARNALNVNKISGQRIYVELEGQFRLLTMPSMFEIGFNYVRWHYKTAEDTLIITNYTAVKAPEIRLHVASASGKAYRYLVSSQITMNVAEYELPYQMEQAADGGLVFRASDKGLSAAVYPELAYKITVEGAAFRTGDEALLAAGAAPSSASLTVLELDSSSEWTLTFQGMLDGEFRPAAGAGFEEEAKNYREFLAGVMNGFQLKKESGEQAELFKVNALAWWYTHNMLVHYSVPHGLEQYGGAAWGTRDVCQGPVEYFLATHKYEQVREILLTVFAHQYEDDGNWPQWFMFDRYTSIQQEESHGDIIVWPLKILGDYLRATRDFAVLDEQIPYTRKHSFDFTETVCTLREHALKELEYIKAHFLHDTFLSSYGDGDWDDTLQPANAQLKQYMVSSWTVALTYQTVLGLSAVLKDADASWSGELKQMAEGIKADFNRYMLGTEVIPGFLYFEDPEQAKLMLHPEDKETGIQYRLLPMTRSMIGELLTPEQMEAHYTLIQEQFLCPDGVRLMNHPAQYAGGVSTHFKRAEQAANFGREIGLQYVHAHIRFVEAMAKTGKTEQVWKGLATINPVGIREAVPNAELRQSNAYFSSSDGKFDNRYEAQERFHELRDGSVPVKGGWKIYSSGPGIYMNQLISNVLGIREEGGDLILDPVLPAELDGTRFEFEYGGSPVTFVYHCKEGRLQSAAVNGREVQAVRLNNPYRLGGLRIAREELQRHAGTERTIIDIYM
ncbi:cellobiose phosphorylase [Paenibacillus sp. FSL R7-0273]|uniref:GH36-type glycosyl hydrolase domain-containing protein n=1 Tax=Paenibacillus sp. FSL R7-0273 TaxID=1536772 RepID=UPI0004F79E06|nr:cellobiose phosphorylase [Paenibacillus sp. FSL R7-0273]AIQ46914.1 cellobiose phosphorylase [Paenibacillus sp. FSL R7-0273]OMF97322.1 cellobiose phosphorylase [Paenibacillus sp. FSL R7-0273]